MLGRNKGFFLILVAAVVAALAAILVQFGVDAQLGTLMSGNFRDEMIARERAESVLDGVRVAIETDHWRDPRLIPFISNQLGGEGTCKGRVRDEEGKLPVNQLIAEGADGIEILQRYWDLRRGSPASFHALIDWIDPDDQTIYGENEASFYGKLGEIPPNRPLQSIFELPKIPFMEKEIERLKKLKERPLRDDLTVWGSGRVNLLTANRDVLMALSDVMTAELAERIIMERDLGHIRTMADFNRVVHVPGSIYRVFQRWGTLESTAFRVRVRLDYRKVRVLLQAVLWRQGLGLKTLYFREGLWQPA
jgi:type II secretory pathway component PulK